MNRLTRLDPSTLRLILDYRPNDRAVVRFVTLVPHSDRGDGAPRRTIVRTVRRSRRASSWLRPARS